MDFQTEVIATVTTGEQIIVEGKRFSLQKDYGKSYPELYLRGSDRLLYIPLVTPEAVMELAEILSAYLATIGYAKTEESVEDISDTLG